MEEEQLYDRIGETDFNPTYVDGQTFLHTDVNKIVAITKEGVNENYHDIQKLQSGTKSVGNAIQLDGATLSKYLDEPLQANDDKVPTSQQVKEYVDGLFSDFSAPVRGVDYWTEADKQEIIDEASEGVESEIDGILEDYAKLTDIPSNVSSFTNDRGYLVEDNLQMVDTSVIENGSQITDGTGYGRLNKIYGNTIQNGTPTPDNPIDIDVVTGDVTIQVSDANNTSSQSYNLSLGDIELCKIGDYKDYIYSENGKWYKHSEIGKVILQGTENWGYVYGSTNPYRYYVRGLIADRKSGNDVLISNYFKQVTNLSSVGMYNGQNINFGISDKTTIEAFETWLTTYKPTIYYVLDSAVDTEITDLTLIEQLNAIRNFILYENETDFTISSEDLLPSLDITYAITNRDIYSKEEVNDLIGDIKIKTKDHYFNSVAEMKSAQLKIGDIATTLGYYSANDGGGAKYLIQSTSSQNDYIEPLNNGLYAKCIDNLLNNYYDEITTQKSRFYDTDCYITTIPYNDNEGNQIDIYVDKIGTGDSPTVYAQKNKTTLTINASLNIVRPELDTAKIPSIIGNGQIIRTYDDNSLLPDCYEYVGFKADRSVTTYKVNNTTAQDMIDDGVINAFDVFYKLIDNGTRVDLSTIHPTTGDEVITKSHPRQCVGIKSDKTIIILTTEGRSLDNKGLTSLETQNILLDLNCVNAWNLDGGGSTSTSIKGVKINQNYDDDGTTDRPIPYILNVKKNIVNKPIADIYSFIGKNNQDIFDILMPIYKFFNVSDLTGLNCNNLIGKLYFGYGNGMVNKPSASGYNYSNGWFINMPHTNPEFKDLYNKQIFIYRDSNNIFQREMVNGTWGDWEHINEKISVRIITDYNANVLSASDTYQDCIFTSIDGNISGLNYISYDNETKKQITINKYCKIKVSAILSLESKGDNDKFIRFQKNGSAIGTSLTKVNIANNTTGYLVTTDIIAVTPSDKLTLIFRGTENDKIYRGYITIEEI